MREGLEERKSDYNQHEVVFLNTRRCTCCDATGTRVQAASQDSHVAIAPVSPPPSVANDVYLEGTSKPTDNRKYLEALMVNFQFSLHGDT